jgi:amino acid transporter
MTATMGQNASALPTREQETQQPQLRRVLGRWDLVLLFVVAVFNLNVVPSIAANGGITLWLWLISVALFFWQQGIAVIELSRRYPDEGGVYLWAKKEFGDFHGFLSGWCYWTNNMLYVPTVLLYFVGVSVFVLGPGHEGSADNKLFALVTSVALLAVLVLLKFARHYEPDKSHYSRAVLFLAGLAGLITTMLGIGLVFFPARQITSLAWYELNMVGGTVFFIGLAVFFFFVYGRRKVGSPDRIHAKENHR